MPAAPSAITSAAAIVAAAPTIIADKSERAERSIRYRWLIGETPDGSRVYAELLNVHSGNQHCYRAMLNRITVEPVRSGPFYSEVSMPLEQVRVHTSGLVKRYSAKGLRAFADEARVQLAGMIDAGHENAVRHFRPVDQP